MKKQTLDLPIINHHAAGIDVGSKEHCFAIGQNDTGVKVFWRVHQRFSPCWVCHE